MVRENAPLNLFRTQISLAYWTQFLVVSNSQCLFVCFCLYRFFWFVLQQWNFIIHLLKLWNNFILTLAWKTPLTWAAFLAQSKRKLLHAQSVSRGVNTKIQHLSMITVEKRLMWLKTPNGPPGRMSVAGLSLNFQWIFTNMSILILNQL